MGGSQLEAYSAPVSVGIRVKPDAPASKIMAAEAAALA
jgi:hypothetical protein